MSANNTLPILISAEALEAIQSIREFKNIPAEFGLRIGVKGKGCSIDNFFLGFDLCQENDKIFQIKDLPIFITKTQLLYLAGMKLHYEEDEDGSMGFAFHLVK